jgi:hypothetical protein
MRAARIPQVLFFLTLPFVVAGWWGCAKGSGESTGGSSSTGISLASGTGGSGVGGGGIDTDGGTGGKGGACATTSVESHPVPIDLIFLVDQSDSMIGDKWAGTSKAVEAFFNDPASSGIGVGLEFMPKTPDDCVVSDYENLVVPIAPLPGNAFTLTNAMPAQAGVYGTPMYGALKGALMVATAFQDAHPLHKVSVVLATDAVLNSDCNSAGIDKIAPLAKSALEYDGVRTYAIGVEGTIIADLDQIAAAGGTTAAFDVTQDISQFSAALTALRKNAVGCDFEIPAPPNGKELDPKNVNFSYTPGGMGTSQVLPRANSLADCHGQPGWYFDNNSNPTTIVLCPASCTTVENDEKAKVDVLFGCRSVLN